MTLHRAGKSVSSELVPGVEFMRQNGSRGQVWNVPADAKAGDHVSVLYRPDGGNGFIYSYDMVWRVPVFASIVGVASVLLGLFFRRRSGGLFRELHENAA